MHPIIFYVPIVIINIIMGVSMVYYSNFTMVTWHHFDKSADKMLCSNPDRGARIEIM